MKVWIERSRSHALIPLYHVTDKLSNRLDVIAAIRLTRTVIRNNEMQIGIVLQQSLDNLGAHPLQPPLVTGRLSSAFPRRHHGFQREAPSGKFINFRHLLVLDHPWQ